MSIKLLKWGAVISFVVSMVVLLAGGYMARSKVPPYPLKFLSDDGRNLYTKADLLAGQDVYQKYGLMNHGSVWGHGSQRGMDFSATSAHMVGETMRDYYAIEQFNKPFKMLSSDESDSISAKVINELKTNRYNETTGELTLTKGEEAALDRVTKYWGKEFLEGDNGYGFLPETIKSEVERANIGKFFFWTAWVASTNRPNSDYTYTNNWPPDISIGNRPSQGIFIWSLGGILGLFLVLGLTVYLVHRHHLFFGEPKGAELAEKLVNMPLTVSQYRAAKFFLVVILLFILQTMMGGLLAHYTVNPAHFYIPIVAKIIPYSWAKTWHLQLAVFWIATTWVGSAIYLAPIISGKEPKGQGLLVNLLFVAVLIVAVGSLTGEVLGIKGIINKMWFWFGHQGWEYLELGRFWQILLFGGLLFWLFIVYRSVKDKITWRHDDEQKALITFYVFSAVFVVLFFGFGLFYGQGTNLTVADYWRWFVVHLWVESIFEFFGVAVISLFLVILGLADAKSALRVAYFTAILVFLSGIIGTAHHYFWFGGPAFWLMLGSVFSSMEPVPLILLVVRAWMEYRTIEEKGVEFPYRWPLMFLVASSVWNFVGAGVFGFLINLPIINYYEHGTYLTLNHAHTALFGVYGMMSVSILLFVWRGLTAKEYWNDKLLRVVFWGLNGGLFLMAFVTLFPVGILQVLRSFNVGMWSARSAEFFNTGAVKALGTIRILPDSVIILFGVLPLAYFLVRTYPHLKKPLN